MTPINRSNNRSQVNASGRLDNDNSTNTDTSPEVHDAMMKAAMSFMGGQLQNIIQKQKEAVNKLKETSGDD